MATTTKNKRMQQGKHAPASAKQPCGWIAGLTEDCLEQEGSRLLTMLFAKAQADGLRLTALAIEKLHVHPSYLSQLRTGARPVDAISHEFAKACAAYLGIPLISVLVAAGQLKEEDFREDLDEGAIVDNAISFIMRDPHLGLLFPETLPKQDKALKKAVVRLYEMATGKLLLSETRISAAKLAVFAQSARPPTQNLKRKPATGAAATLA